MISIRNSGVARNPVFVGDSGGPVDPFATKAESARIVDLNGPEAFRKHAQYWLAGDAQFPPDGSILITAQRSAVKPVFPSDQAASGMSNQPYRTRQLPWHRPLDVRLPLPTKTARPTTPAIDNPSQRQSFVRRSSCS